MWNHMSCYRFLWTCEIRQVPVGVCEHVKPHRLAIWSQVFFFLVCASVGVHKSDILAGKRTFIKHAMNHYLPACLWTKLCIFVVFSQRWGIRWIFHREDWKGDAFIISNGSRRAKLWYALNKFSLSLIPEQWKLVITNRQVKNFLDMSQEDTC